MHFQLKSQQIILQTLTNLFQSLCEEAKTENSQYTIAEEEQSWRTDTSRLQVMVIKSV